MFENPFGTNLQDLQTTYLQQMQTMQAMQQQKQASVPVLEEINKIVSSMSSEEQAVMAESREYQLAKQTYEAGFWDIRKQICCGVCYYSRRKIAANNLLTTIKQQKERVNEGLRAKQQKLTSC